MWDLLKTNWIEQTVSAAILGRASPAVQNQPKLCQVMKFAHGYEGKRPCLVVHDGFCSIMAVLAGKEAQESIHDRTGDAENPEEYDNTPKKGSMIRINNWGVSTTSQAQSEVFASPSKIPLPVMCLVIHGPVKTLAGQGNSIIQNIGDVHLRTKVVQALDFVRKESLRKNTPNLIYSNLNLQWPRKNQQLLSSSKRRQSPNKKRPRIGDVRKALAGEGHNKNLERLFRSVDEDDESSAGETPSKQLENKQPVDEDGDESGMPTGTKKRMRLGDVRKALSEESDFLRCLDEDDESSDSDEEQQTSKSGQYASVVQDHCQDGKRAVNVLDASKDISASRSSLLDQAVDNLEYGNHKRKLKACGEGTSSSRVQNPEKPKAKKAQVPVVNPYKKRPQKDGSKPGKVDKSGTGYRAHSQSSPVEFLEASPPVRSSQQPKGVSDMLCSSSDDDDDAENSGNTEKERRKEMETRPTEKQAVTASTQGHKRKQNYDREASIDSTCRYPPVMAQFLRNVQKACERGIEKRKSESALTAKKRSTKVSLPGDRIRAWLKDPLARNDK